MSFDALALAALRQELTDLLVGGRVQRIVRVSELGLGLEIYAGERYQLLLSAEVAAPQIRIVEHKLRRGEEKPSPLSLLLKKHVDGSRLVAVTQPELERILSLRFAGEHGEVRLICELMGNLSNLILVNADERIMESAKRVPASVNRYREVLPRRPYVPPPPQDKLLPLAMTSEELLSALTQAEGPLFRRLLQAVAGVSPLLAREVVHRTMGSSASGDAAQPDRDVAEALQSELVALWRLPETGQWQPSVGYARVDGVRTPRVFAPYVLTHWPDHELCVSLQEAASRVLDEAMPTEGASSVVAQDGYARARQRLLDMIERQIERREHRLASMREGLVSPEELEALRFAANAILAVSWRIEPGQKEISVAREEVTGESGPEAQEMVRLQLDPTLSPTENAQALFAEYRKRQSAQEQVPALIAATEVEIATLRQLATDVALAQDRGELDEIELTLREAGFAKSRRKMAPPQPSEPLVLRSLDGMQILVGRNSRQNAEVTFRRSTPDDLWLHAHGVPGSHVIIRCGTQSVSTETLTMAARLAAYYSAARAEARVQVDATARKHVRPITGAGPGMVTYRNEETLIVAPDVSDIEGIPRP